MLAGWWVKFVCISFFFFWLTSTTSTKCFSVMMCDSTDFLSDLTRRKIQAGIINTDPIKYFLQKLKCLWKNLNKKQHISDSSFRWNVMLVKRLFIGHTDRTKILSASFTWFQQLTLAVICQGQSGKNCLIPMISQSTGAFLLTMSFLYTAELQNAMKTCIYREMCSWCHAMLPTNKKKYFKPLTSL